MRGHEREKAETEGRERVDIKTTKQENNRDEPRRKRNEKRGRREEDTNARIGKTLRGRGRMSEVWRM